MKNPRNIFAKISVAVTVLLALGTAAVAKKHSDAAFSNIHIGNFGKMDDRFYRGAQPDEQDIKDLAALGVKTVIDLRNDPVSYEKQSVEAVGMRYVNIPMSDKDYPQPAQINAFLKLVDDPATGKFFVHCAGGKHRTGVMGAVYRFTHDHWNYDQVYAEMKDYNFSTAWGHSNMKKYVENFWAGIASQQNQGAASATATKQ